MWHDIIYFFRLIARGWKKKYHLSGTEALLPNPKRRSPPPFQPGAWCDPVDCNPGGEEIRKANTCPGELSGYNKEVGLGWFIELIGLQAQRDHN